jgi:transcriptional regulator with XRE-family HTH domain
MIDGNKIRALRVQQNKSLEDVSRATNLSIHTIQRIETGKTPNPGIEAVVLIAKTLLVDIDDLLLVAE